MKIWLIAVVSFLVIPIAIEANELDLSGRVEVRGNLREVAGENEECRLELEGGFKKFPALRVRAWSRTGLQTITTYAGFPAGGPLRFDGGAEVSFEVKGDENSSVHFLYGHESRHGVDLWLVGDYATTWLGVKISYDGKIAGVRVAVDGVFKEHIKSQSTHYNKYQDRVLDYGRTGTGGWEGGINWYPGDFPKSSLGIGIWSISKVLGHNVQPYLQAELVQPKRTIKTTPRQYFNVLGGAKVDLTRDIYLDLRYTDEIRPEDSTNLSKRRSTGSVAIGVQWGK